MSSVAGLLGIEFPIIQAPLAGVQGSALAAAAGRRVPFSHEAADILSEIRIVRTRRLEHPRDRDPVDDRVGREPRTTDALSRQRPLFERIDRLSHGCREGSHLNARSVTCERAAIH